MSKSASPAGTSPTTTPTATPRRIIPERECGQYDGGLSRATRWRYVQAGNYPRPVKLSPGKSGYFVDELIAWQEKLAAQRGAR